MITILAFLLTLVGSINWLMIGLLQYDFIAGIFGYQASILSRIVYIIIGAASFVIVFKLFKGKGTLAVLSKRNKKDVAEKVNKMGKEKEFERGELAHSYNIESGEDSYRDEDIKESPRGLFDDHFDNGDDL